mgnify:FL=1
MSQLFIAGAIASPIAMFFTFCFLAIIFGPSQPQPISSISTFVFELLSTALFFALFSIILGPILAINFFLFLAAPYVMILTKLKCYNVYIWVVGIVSLSLINPYLMKFLEQSLDIKYFTNFYSQLYFEAGIQHQSLTYFFPFVTLLGALIIFNFNKHDKINCKNAS